MRFFTVMGMVCFLLGCSTSPAPRLYTGGDVQLGAGDALGQVLFVKYLIYRHEELWSRTITPSSNR